MSQTLRMKRLEIIFGEDAVMIDVGAALLRFNKIDSRWQPGAHSIKTGTTKLPGLIGEYRVDPAVEKRCLEILNHLSTLERMLNE